MKNLFLIGILFLTFTAFSQNEQTRKKHYNIENGLALQGYDAVAYFDNKALEGEMKFSLSHKGLTYYFSSEKNKQTFQKNPTMYEPQYGGWCAFAMGDYGKKVEVNPKTFKILDGKLYLFYDAYFNNTLKKWNKDEKNLKTKADKNWNNTIN